MTKKTTADLQRDIRDLKIQVRDLQQELGQAMTEAAHLKGQVNTANAALNDHLAAKARLKKLLSMSREETARLQGRLQQIDIQNREASDKELVSVERHVLQPHAMRAGDGNTGIRELLNERSGTEGRHWTAE